MKTYTTALEKYSIAHISNVVGDVRPIKDIIKLAHKNNILVLVDGAQSVPHLKVDVQDLDIDFIRYSLDDSAIETFIEKLNDKDIKIKITSPIKRLHHQDYDGKRVFIDISDNFGNVFSTKLDVGVHKDIDIDQDELCFDLGIESNSVILLANSKEQICVEKIKSLLKFGITSTRYKDIFDIYYLINKSDFDKHRFFNYLDKLIFKNELIEESNIRELHNNLKNTLSNEKFKSMVNNAKNNWLEVSIDDTINSILDFISSLELVEV